MLRRVIHLTLTALIALVVLRAPAWAGAEDWNDAEIKWMDYTKGLEKAKESGRPVCLIFFTSWCPHCANYSKVFKDPKLVDKAKSFVMVRLEADKNRDISEKYHPDGDYIPRTFFLSKDGEVDLSLTEARPTYKYFYEEGSPAGILAGMDRALAKFGGK